MKLRKYTEKQISILQQYYPKGDWDSILPYFPNQSKRNIRAFARRFGIRVTDKPCLNKADYTGKTYGRLTVIGRDEQRKNYWYCECECGNKISVQIHALISGGVKSCGCLLHAPGKNSKDFTGQKFGMLTAVERLPRYNGKDTFYRCVCDCGRTDVIVRSGNLRSGHVVSCGTHNHKKIEYTNLLHQDDTDRTYVVYRHISPNGKSYIGITKQNAERRFQKGIGYKTQPAFWRAIKKYGWENFQHEILEENLTEKEAGERESYYIREVFNSFAPNGYNVAEGGASGNKVINPVIQYYNGEPVNFFATMGEAIKFLDISSQTIRRHMTPEEAVRCYHFVQLPAIHSYEIPSKYLTLVNEEHYGLRSVIADNLRTVTVTRNVNCTSKKINKYDLHGKYLETFSSISKARRTIEGSDGGAISAAVNPNRAGDTAYGFMWKYDTGSHDDIEPVRYKARRPVYQIDMDTGKIISEFLSIAEAARSVSGSCSPIQKVCHGLQESYKGYKWVLKDCNRET